MMILSRYIAKTVIQVTLLVSLVVLGLTYFINFLGELRDIGVGDYGVIQAAMHVLLELPHAVYQLFPMLVLLGGIIGLGALATHRELTVMQISGMSMRHILGAVLMAALILNILVLPLGEILSPRGHYLADKHKSIAQSGGQAIATEKGVWFHEGNNFFHIQNVITPRYLEGVTRYEFDHRHQLLAAYYSKTMRYTAGQWHLADVVKTRFNQDHTQREAISAATWDIMLKPQFLKIGLLEPDEMPLPQLRDYIQHLVQNGLHASEFQFNFWKRVFTPLTIMIMLLLAVPFVFAAPRSSMGLRLLLGILLGFVFYILNSLLGQISIVFQLSPFYAALLPIFIFSLVGYGLVQVSEKKVK